MKGIEFSPAIYHDGFDDVGSPVVNRSARCLPLFISFGIGKFIYSLS